MFHNPTVLLMESKEVLLVLKCCESEDNEGLCAFCAFVCVCICFSVSLKFPKSTRKLHF